MTVMLSDPRMADLLIKLAGRDCPADLGQTFRYTAVISVVSAEWGLSRDDSQAGITDWLVGRGEVDHSARPPELRIYHVSWEALLARAR